MKKIHLFSFKEWISFTSSGQSFFRQLLFRATHNIACVRDISYSRTAIDLHVAIYELERALHDRRRSMNIIFLRKEAWERSWISSHVCRVDDCRRCICLRFIVPMRRKWYSFDRESYPSMKSMWTSFNVDRWNSNFRSRRGGGLHKMKMARTKMFASVTPTKWK